MKQKNHVELESNVSKLDQDVTEEMRRILKLPPCRVSRSCMSASSENPLGCMFYKKCRIVRNFLIL